MEFHGDRNYGDDKAIIGGIAKFHGKPVTVIVQEKGTNTKENIAHNFGMPMPEGYRKALRLMKQAEKFQRPVICLWIRRELSVVSRQRNEDRARLLPVISGSLPD